MARGTPTTYVYSSDEIWVYGYSEYVGDDWELYGNVRGGNDHFVGEDNTYGSWAMGDSYWLEGPAKGGNDTYEGGDNVGSGDPFDVLYGGEDIAFFAGDSFYMDGGAGGNDTMTGGENSSNSLFGDAVVAYGKMQAGADNITGGDAYAFDEYETSANLLIGDAYSFGEGRKRLISESDMESRPSEVTGGADEITGGSSWAVYGDAYAINLMAGDGYSMMEASKGAGDRMYGGDAFSGEDGMSGALNVMLGDAFVIYDTSKGGSDRMVGGDAHADGGDAYAMNLMIGDAYAMFGRVGAGNDTITGGSAEGGDMYGDAYAMNLLVGDTLEYGGTLSFGNDQLMGGDGGMGEDDAQALNVMFGDIGDIDDIMDFIGEDIIIDRAAIDDFISRDEQLPPGLARMGADYLQGGDGWAENHMVGDAAEIWTGSRGGNDTIVGGGEGSMNYLVGDAFYIAEGAAGGRDRLVSGEGEDEMWGDARYENAGVGGSDTFVMIQHGGNDVVWDFNPSQRDRIDLKAFDGVDGFGSYRELEARMVEEEDGVYIDLSIGEESAGVFLAGISLDELNSRSFLF